MDIFFYKKKKESKKNVIFGLYTAAEIRGKFWNRKKKFIN